MTDTKKSEPAKAAKPVVVEQDYVYTSGLQNLQESEETLSKATQTIADAVKEGIDTYLDARAQSAASKKDGALEDLFVNSAKGVSAAAKAGSAVIEEVAESIDSYFFTDSQKKDLKRSIRAISRLRVPFPLPIPFVSSSDDDDDDED